ncbi:hypothetical protein Glove_168g135 [Diversispora epigaea]|uniref:Uncharacterized protein n=1 Tax=Diversispora epigaea TaxID=1348612 RepID=A0A397IPY1_9GLOM|nr:hypothetical protein Glove_168g135 [Diversispora epigaea]
MFQEKEFYSKLCVAGSIKFGVDKATREDKNLSGNARFSCNLATILARDSENVAVNLKILSNKYKVYIAKDSAWLGEDLEYINKVKGILTNVSKDAPMSLEKAHERNDVKDLVTAVMKYCSNKIEYRLDKLKKYIADDEEKIYIKSFLNYAKTKIDVDDTFKKKLAMSKVCFEYYQISKKDSTISKKFLRHIKKVGSYFGSLMDITDCVRKERYKASFSCIDIHLLDPITTNQLIYSWNDIIKRFIPIPEEYEYFKKVCLEDCEIKKRLENVYDSIDTQMNCENSIHICLHAELNVLTNIMDQGKEKKFIAVSKRCCYLCESYIRFLRSKGYKITVSGTNQKLYHGWKLPDAFKKEFMSDTLFNLDLIIESKIEYHTNIIDKSDSDYDYDTSIIDWIDNFEV